MHIVKLDGEKKVSKSTDKIMNHESSYTVFFDNVFSLIDQCFMNKYPKEFEQICYIFILSNFRFSLDDETDHL